VDRSFVTHCTKPPLQRIGIDTLGPLRKGKHGNVKIIVITDHMTKWAIARLVAQENAETIAETLLEEVFLRFCRNK